MDQKENEWTNGSQYETEQQLPNQSEFQNPAKTSFHKRETSKPIVQDLATTQLAPAMEGQDLVRQFELIAKYLEKKGADWADRVGSLEKLHHLADADAAQHEEFLAFLIRLRDPLIIQIKDLRSQIVKEACGTIGSIALGFQRLGQANGSLKLPKGWPSLALAFMETSLKQTPVTIKVISEAALDCVRTIIKSAAPFGIQKMAEKLCAGASDKSSHIRLVCIQCIALAMDEWTMFARSGTSAKVWIEIRNTLKSGLFDSDENVRKAARECFWSFHECAKEPAEHLLNMQDDAVKRRILESRPVHRKQEPNAAEHVQPRTVLGARIDQVTLASTSSSAVRSPSTVSSPEQMISPIRRTWSEDGSHAGSPGTGDTGHRASLDDEQSTIDTIIDSSHDASALAEDSSASSTPMQAPAARPVAVPQQVNPAPRHRGAMRIQRNEEPPVKSAREYNASDYTENGAALRKSTAGARRVAAPQRVMNRNTRAASAAPVQAHQPPSRTSSVGGPQRVDGHSASRSNSMTASSMDMAGAGDPTLSSSQLEHKISAIEASTLWSARVDAVQDIIAAQKAGTSFSASIVSKLVPALCGRADDQHHKVAQEVLQAVCIFLPLYSKEFGEHLRTLLPALLSGLSDSHSTTRRLSNKALNCCIATYPADHLCALLSSICRRNGDKLRQGCVDCLKGLVPRSSSYFSTELHVSQLLSRLEKCLSSRKTDLRTASGDLVEAVFRFDQATFAAVLNSGELPPSLHALVTKVMSSKVKNFASIIAAANAGNQDPSPARAQNASGSLPASTVVPGSNQKGETAVQQTPTVSGTRHERRRSTTGIATPVSSTEGTTVFPDDRRKSALEVLSTSSRSSGTLKSQTPTPEPESTSSQTTSSIHATASSASSVSSQTHSRPSSPTRSTSTTLSPIKGASGDERVRNIISGLVTENTDELNRALRKASELLKAEEKGKQAVDWNRWLGQMLVACLGHITHPDPLSRELALRVITVMATTQPKITSESTEFLFERLLNLFDQPQSVSVADKTLNVLIENLDADRCFATLLAILNRGQEGGLFRRAVQYLRPLLVRVSVVTLKPALPALMPLLLKAFQSSDANSRRSAMHCYVELHAALGDSFSPHLEVLSKVQQKLVAMYIERRKSID